MSRRTASVARLVALALAFVLALGAGVARAATPTSLTLAWTAPGDDGSVGTAAQYDVRVSTSLITAGNFASATVVPNPPAPLAAGTRQTFVVTGLTPATQYWFAIRTVDDAGNWSAISNVVTGTTPSVADVVRPAPLVIAAAGSGPASVTVSFNAVGDDSLTGTAATYDVRWSTSAITALNFSAATHVTSGVPAPAAPGTAQQVTITGLDRSQDLYVAVRVADWAGNVSAVSNSVLFAHLLDTAPPATPSSLAVARSAGGVTIEWAANAEPDLDGYHVWRATSSGGPFARIDGAMVHTNAFVDAAAPDSTLWYAVSAVDLSGNASALSAAVQLRLASAQQFASLHVQPAYPNPAGLTDVVTLPIEVPGTAPLDGRVDIVNSAGERVKTIELHGLQPGMRTITWDGRNDAGRLTAPGVYRALLHAGGTVESVRLVRRP